jgi:hypothetical protein
MMLIIPLVLHEQTRRTVLELVNSYPVSAFINKLQQASIPSNDAACLKELGKRDVRFRRQGDFSEPKGCKVKSAVRLSSAGQVQFDNAPLLTCKMAMQLARFSEDELQSAARDVLGSTVKRVRHIGTYNCRSMRQFKGVLSQHAFANAIDVSAFELSNGDVINVARDWRAKGAKAQFLRRVSSDACNAFHVAVSPDGDANHFNHLHWDMGPYRSCR